MKHNKTKLNKMPEKKKKWTQKIGKDQKNRRHRKKIDKKEIVRKYYWWILILLLRHSCPCNVQRLRKKEDNRPHPTQLVVSRHLAIAFRKKNKKNIFSFLEFLWSTRFTFIFFSHDFFLNSFRFFLVAEGEWELANERVNER